MYKTARDVLIERIEWLNTRSIEITARRQHKSTYPALIKRLEELYESKMVEYTELDTKATPEPKVDALRKEVNEDRKAQMKLEELSDKMARKAIYAKHHEQDADSYKDYEELKKEHDRLVILTAGSAARKEKLAALEKERAEVEEARATAEAIRKEKEDTEAELEDIVGHYADEEKELKEIPLRFLEARACLGLIKAREYTWKEAVRYWSSQCKNRLKRVGACKLTTCLFYDKRLADCKIKLRLGIAPLHWDTKKIEELVKMAGDKEEIR